MYKIEKTPYGVKLIFSGMIQAGEMASWVKESESFAKTLPPEFGVLVDMRELKPLADDAKQEMQKGQIIYKTKGMKRSAVILSSSILTMQFKRIAQETGIYAWERYFNSAVNQNWEAAATDWITKGIDPDK